MPTPLTLPASGNRTLHPAELDASLPLQVLVVDDEPLVRGLLRSLLTHAGYRVETAENGAAALRHLEGSALPDLIVLDLTMPELDGRAFRETQRGRPELAGIPVVICSGEDPAEFAAEFPGCRWVEKPIQMPQLLGAVRETLVSR